MDGKILIAALLAFSLLFFGCAKGGASQASGAQSQPGSVASSAPGSTPPAEQAAIGGGTEGTGTPEQPEAGPEAPAGGAQPQEPATQTGQAGNTSETDLGDLFNIDTTQPESGSGYDVPAAGE